jgi:hypothetical protein
MTMALAGASQASAAVFTLDSYAVTHHVDDPGLKVAVTPLVAFDGNYTTPDLQVGESHTFDLFFLAADEDSINFLEDWAPKPISVLFNFSSPGAAGSIAGTTAGGETCEMLICGWLEWGALEWNAPLVLNFGNGGQFTVELEEKLFAGGVFGLNLFNGTNVAATITYTTAAPEPASILLFGIGAVLMGRRILRKQ